jgi:hypothetical protein
MEIETHSFPLPFSGKYVLIITSTGAPAKNYKHWKAVVDWLKPALNANGYYLVQCGGEKDERIGADFDACGKTSTLQYFDLVKRASLLVCGDTSAVHVAGHFDIPLVALYSISPPEVSRAYFGNPFLQKYLCPEGYSPSFNPNETPAHINRIKVETVVSEACNLLKIKAPQFKTLHLGGSYAQHVLEVVPNVVLRPEFSTGNVVHIRYDKGGVEKAIYDQLSVRKCTVRTRAPLNVEILKQLRQNIEFVAYEIDENHSVEFATALMRAQIPFRLYSRLPDEKLNPIKLDYFDIAIIEKLRDSEGRPELYGKNFITNRRIFSGGKIYLSHAHVREDKSVDNFSKNEHTVLDAPDFWEDKELYCIYE